MGYCTSASVRPILTYTDIILCIAVTSNVCVCKLEGGGHKYTNPKQNLIPALSVRHVGDFLISDDKDSVECKILYANTFHSL